MSLIQPHLKEFWPIWVTKGGRRGDRACTKATAVQFQGWPFKGPTSGDVSDKHDSNILQWQAAYSETTQHTFTTWCENPKKWEHTWTTTKSHHENL